MQVDDQKYLLFLLDFEDVLAGRINLRMRDLVSSMPNSIQIVTRQATSVRTINNSIRVQHGNKLEHKAISQSNRFCCLADQIFHHAFAHKRTGSFPRMHTGHYDNRSLLKQFLLEISDCDNVDAIASRSCSDIPSLKMLACFVGFPHEIFQHSVGIGVAVSEIYLIIVFLKIIRKTEGIVTPRAIQVEILNVSFAVKVYWDVRPAIFDIKAASHPMERITLGCHTNFHPILEY